MMKIHDLRNGANINLIYNLREKFYWRITVTDQDDAPVDLTGKSLTLSIRSTENGTAIDTATVGDGITISTGVVTTDHTFTGLTVGNFFYDLMNTTDSKCIADGRITINYEAR
jgi:hypothetical protein